MLAGKLDWLQSIVVLAGWVPQVIEEPLVTVTEKLQFVEFPHSSVAVKVMVFVPTVIVEPTAGDWETVIFPALEQLSVTVAIEV